MTAFPKPDRYAKRERVDYSGLALAKDVSEPDAKFRADVRRKGCQVKRHSPELHRRCSPVRGSEYSNRRAVIDFAHTPAPGKKGMGKKASDRGNGIGLCHDLHMEQERIGWESFQAKYRIDACAIAQELADDYSRRHDKREGQER